MTRTEHYRKAEELLRLAGEASSPDDEMTDAEVVKFIATTTTCAQVHATLALAASFAEVNPTSAWHEVAS